MKTNLNRRNFIKYTGLGGVAFALGIQSTDAANPEEIINLSQNSQFLEGSTFEVTPFVIIEKSGKITIMNSKAEMGQGTFQSIPALIAEELEVSLDQVTIKQTGGEKKFGGQTAGGSASVRTSYANLRKTGAAAREMLIKAASDKWQVPATECYAENAKIFHKPTGKSLTYGELAEDAAKLEVPKSPTLKDPKDFKILGKSIKRPDIPLKVNGSAVFGIDAEVPDMLYVSVERSPVFGGKVKSFDATEALKVKGVKQVIKAERILNKNHFEGIAVIAENYWAAVKGRKTLKIDWDFQGLDKFNTKDYEQSLRDAAKNDGILDGKIKGDFEKTFAESTQKIEAFYETPIVSHSPMEPMSCVAHWKSDNSVEIWVSSQGADSVKRSVADAFGIQQDDVKVNLMFNGGGFGRRLFQDFATEAVDISKKIGKPVKVVWTREDDTQQGPFRPMTYSAFKGGLSADGKIVAFQHKVISPSIGATNSANFDKNKIDGTMVEGISEQQYAIPNMKNSFVFVDIPVPLGYWRAVTSTTLAFSHECFIDELAIKANKDPLIFRMEMLEDKSDTARIFKKLKEVSSWEKPLPKGWGRGVAQWEFFAGQAAQVVEVSKQKNGSIKIEKVFVVIDLGTVVNPDNTKAQVEGAVVMAIGAATKDGITFENGRVQQSNFHDNRMVRISEMPKVEVHILAEGGTRIRGVGEPGLPPFAPALANAIFNLTGKRLRRLPMNLDT